MARIVQHTPEYGVAIALSNKRIVKYESINGANFTGWYHGDGLISVYKNLDIELPDNVRAGEEIFEGDIIGMVGESAIIEIADEPHLHFELSLDGASVDPLDFFDYKATAAPEDEEISGK